MLLLSDWFPLHCRFFEKTKNCNTCCSSCYLIGQRTIKWWSKYSCAFWNLTEVNRIDLRMKYPLLTLDVLGSVLIQSTENQRVACCLHASLALYSPPQSVGYTFQLGFSSIWQKPFIIFAREDLVNLAGLEKQHVCETDGKLQEEQQLFPPTESALHGQTCFFWGNHMLTYLH